MYQHSQRTNPLSEEHRRQLEEGSAIAREVLEHRGYRSVARAEVPPEFANYQRRTGLLIPFYSPDGITTGYQLRPDSPRRNRKNGKPIKYETPSGGRIVADVHPTMLEAIGDVDEPLWITEGLKKGDALTSRGRCTLALIGVWGWKRDGAMLACFDHVALRGRRVYAVPDSDVHTNPSVAQAFEELVGDLEDRGARVLVVYLPDAPDGSKLGVDDYLAAGGTVEHMEEIARPFTPSDAARERMSRNDRLQGDVAELRRIWSGHDWRGIGGHTRRELLRAMLEDAERRGEPVPGGIRVRAAQRPLAERIGSRQPTVAAGLRTLEHEDGLIQRDTDQGRPAHAPAAYILLTPGREGRARAYQEGEMGGGRDRTHHSGKMGNCRGYDPGDTPLRALEEIQRLRWSYVARVWTEDGYQHEYVDRLGKIAGRVLEALISAGGHASVTELAEAVGHSRPRDLRRRQLAKLEAAELAHVEGETVILVGDWPEKLGIARELGREYEAEKLARERHARQRAAYREYRKKGETLDRDEVARMRRERQRDRRGGREARRQRARDLDRELRPNYWNWRKRDHLSRAGADGFLRELAPESEPDPPEPARKLPPMVDGIYEHGALCDCAWCADSPEPSYSRTRGVW